MSTSLPGNTPLDPESLRDISQRTLEHYNQRAVEFRAGTADHDVTQNIAALLEAIEAPPPWRLLDFGCGPGRDLKVFAALGHEAVGLDGSAEFAEMARKDSGCEVLQQDFLAMDLRAGFFDGVYANATPVHVPSAVLPRVLRELHMALKPGGVLFASIPHGDNSEGWNRGRYGVYHDLASWRRYLTGAGFTELHHYYRPAGLPREQQPWLASVWRAGT